MEIKPEYEASYDGVVFDRLCHAVTSSAEGKALFEALRATYIEKSYFDRQDYSLFGGVSNYLFFKHGEANLIRVIEQRAQAHVTNSQIHQG